MRRRLRLAPLAVLLLAALASEARAQFPIPVLGPDNTDYSVVQLEYAPDGALYAIGMFKDSLAIGGAYPNAAVRWPSPNETGFLARFDAEGTLEWIHILEARRGQFGDEASAEARRIAVLDDGAVVVLGTITATLVIDLDPGAGEALVAPEGTNPNAFLVAYEPDGAYRWSGSVEMTGAPSLVSRLGLDAADGVVYALFRPGPDADPGPAVVAATNAPLVAVSAADGATRWVRETSIAAGTLFSPVLAQDLAAGGGSVYVLGHAGFTGNTSYRLAHHDAGSGDETWTFASQNGRDVIDVLEADAAGFLYAAAPLSSSSTGVALDPAAPATITHSRGGDERTALASYTPGGALRWSVRTNDNLGAFGQGFDLDGGEAFVSGFGRLNVYATADGALLRSLPDVYGVPSLYDVAAHDGHVAVYVNPNNNDARRFRGLPADAPPTVIVNLRRGDLSAVVTDAESAEIPEAATVLGGVHPHPVAARADVLLRLDRPAPVHVALYDLLGRRIAVLADGALPSGDHLVPLDAADLAPGVYVLSVRHAGRSDARTVVVAR